jgi:hypothetical protein
MQRIRHDLSPEAAEKLEKLLDLVDGLEAIDVVHIANNLLCLGLINLPVERREGIVEGITKYSIPRTMHEFTQAKATGRKAMH